jgi:aminomethyltransferase
MPVQYEGVKAEHEAVRQRAGLFDVSHMGEVVFRGPDAERAVQRLVPAT